MVQRCFIDVGGVVYATTRRTLSKCAMLEKLLAEHDASNDPNGLPPFVDRDGFYFQYVLNFLRNNTLTLPSNEKLLIDALLHEAAFFKLRDMERQLSDL